MKDGQHRDVRDQGCQPHVVGYANLHVQFFFAQLPEKVVLSEAFDDKNLTPKITKGADPIQCMREGPRSHDREKLLN